ncbi:phage gene 29 protein family protein (plasmid) [Nocardia sp. CA-151230]|uniref:phage gene 29 protein family protein n=1 Tax=Nocardia sp. CA-151230 TaxID=3239982 RepID=UPI003D93442B
MDITSMTRVVTQDTADMDDPRQHVAWALAFFPSPNPQMGAVPVYPVVREMQSELLVQFGFKHHPELQTKWLIPGDHPEAGWYNTPKVVDRDEYDEWLAAHADPEAEAEKWKSTAEALLGTLNPKLAKSIADMTPEQKAQAAELQKKALPPEFARLVELAQKENAE